MIPLLQTKTADTAHTGIFASNTRPLSRFLGGAWGRGYAWESLAWYIFSRDYDVIKIGPEFFRTERQRFARYSTSFAFNAGCV